MSTNISRQYGLHEIPGTEVETPNPRRQVSANFESQMRDYVGSIWLKMSELERKVVNLEEWRDELNYRLASRVSPEPPSAATPPAEAKGERARPSPPEPSSSVKPRKPWELEGVSKATWYRRQKEASA
jgi:hypothetical protein